MNKKQPLLSVAISILLSTFVTTVSVAKQWEQRNIDNTFGLNNSSINAILQDRKGMVWIGTWDGLNRYDGNSMQHFSSMPNNHSSLSNPVIRDILEENDSILWIVTEYGINRFSKRLNTSRQFFLDSPANIGYIEKAFIATISKGGTIVANYNGGRLFVYDRGKQAFVPLNTANVIDERISGMRFDADDKLIVCGNSNLYMAKVVGHDVKIVGKTSLPSNVGSMTFDNVSTLWIQKDGRLSYLRGNTLVESGMSVAAKVTCIAKTPKGYIVGTENGCYAFFANQQPKLHLANVNITAAMYGKQGVIWIGTDGRGLYQFFECEQIINSYKIGERSLPVRSIFKKGNKLFVGTKGEGLLVYQINQNRQMEMLENHNVGPGRSNNAVFALCNSKEGRIWVGTDGIGLHYYKEGRLHEMPCLNGRDREKILSVYSIVETSDTTLFLGCSGSGLLKVTLSGNAIKSVRQYGKSKDENTKSDIVYSVITDGGFIWAGTRGGGLMRLNTKTGKLDTYRNEPGNNQSLWNNDIISLYKDRKGRIWIGMSKGLDMMTTIKGEPVFKHFNNIGLPDLNIHSIQEDCKGNLWVSTSKGVSRLNKAGEPLNFSHSDGLQGNEFSDGAGLTWNGGKSILFGGTNGISAIHPLLLEEDSYMPQLQLCDVKADHVTIPLVDKYLFDYDMVSCQFSFAIMDFISNDRCDLSYRLERRSLWDDNDKDWINIGNRREILLNHLVPGNYVLRVRQSNSTHVWSDAPLEIPFSISYPLWARWWSVCIYIALAVYIVWQIYQNKKRKLQMRHERELEKQAMKNKEDIHHAKLRFFASVASRFSSHITHVYHAIEDIRTYSYEQGIGKNIEKISDNVNDMDRLIKRLSEIQSAENDNIEITPEQFHLCEAIKYSLDPYANQITEHGVALDIGIEPTLVLTTDKMLFLKAVHNILNYVFRSIGDNSLLAIGCKPSPNKLAVEISYSGQVPKKDDIENIFNSFRALDIYENDMKRGEDVKFFRLTISNEIAKRLGGYVEIRETSATMATIAIVVSQMPKAAIEKERNNEKTKSKIDTIIKSKKQAILLIDDDENMTELIKTSLDNDFNITTIAEGNFEPDRDMGHSYDLIIYEPTSPENQVHITAIKTSENTRFTPIIAICSSNDKDAGAEMLRQGANSILEKPFRRDYLKAMVERELTATDQMRDYFESPLSYMRKIGSDNMTNETTEFLYSVVDKIGKNYQNEDYNAKMLAADLAMSRTQLYRKFKLFTDVSPTDFILEFRMDRAEKLLKSTDRSISEIVGLCGFRNRAFFYREFTTLHNCSPKEYREANK
ncbi:MAG: two-component regulator propeller domain-containing protein [Prevotella sp.]